VARILRRVSHPRGLLDRILIAVVALAVCASPINVRAASPAQGGACERQETACPLSPSEPAQGVLTTLGVPAIYALQVPAPARPVRLELSSLPGDYDLYLVNASQEVLAQSVQEGTTPELIEVPLLAPGRYYAYVVADPGREVFPANRFVLTLLLGDPPAAGAAPTAPTPQAATQLVGGVLFADNFDDPAAGRLSKTSPSPAQYTRGYVDGEYRIAKVDPTYNRAPGVAVPGTHGNLSIAVDARVVGSTESAYASLTCRGQSTPSSSHYRFTVVPGEGEFSLSRWDNGTEIRLVDDQWSPTIKMGNVTNRLTLLCAGRTIAARINDTWVASLQDDTYLEGPAQLLMGAFSGSSATPDVRFDNLVVTQEADQVNIQITPVQHSPGTVLLRETFDNPQATRMPRSSADPTHYQRGIADGEYFLRTVDPKWDRIAPATLPGTFGNFVMAIDARVLSPSDRRYVIVNFRVQSGQSGTSGFYRFLLEPFTQRYSLARWDSGKQTLLAGGTKTSTAIKRGHEVNRIEIRTSGPSIEVLVNGTSLVQTQDSTYKDGFITIGAGAYSDTPRTVEARFDNLVVTQN
jgi:hypothetical protein